MKNSFRFLIVALAASFIALGAAPSLATPSSQIWIPSTDTQAAGTFHLGIDNYTTVMKKAEDGGHSFPTDFGITAGVADTEALGVELGIDLREQSDHPMYFNFKLQIKEDSLARFFPAIAIGAYDFGTESDMTDYNIAYILIAKTFPALGRLSVGYYTGNQNLLNDSSGNTDNDGFLASYDRTLAEIDDRLWLAVDYMSQNNAYGALSFGLSWRFAPEISALLGYNIFNDEEVAGKNTVTVQIDIDF